MSTVPSESVGVLRKLRSHQRSRGFTLIELMLVVVIIGVLSSFALPYFQRMTTRARRTEVHQVFAKLELYFINQFENNGTFLGDQGVVAGTAVAFNPPVGGAPLGQAAIWSSAVPGWTNVPFSFDGGLKLRYSYTINTGGASMTLTAVGNMPGLGTNTVSYNGLTGNYLFTETLQGPSITSVEVPSM